MKAESIANKENIQKGSFIKALIKGALFSLSITLLAICIFAFLLRFLNISTDLIKPINQVIKIASILLGTFFGMKKSKEMGLITGFLIGILYTLISFLVFSLLNGAIVWESTLLNDMLFGGIAGSISGIMAVNLRKNR